MVRPTPDERADVEAAADELVDLVREALDARDWPGEPLLVGSVAKDTYLHGHADLDVFVQFPADTPRAELESRGLELGRAVFDDHEIAYAEHPYVRGRYGGFDGEVVPCYLLPTADAIQSAVDRTPFHTRYVAAHLDAAGRDEVRLLKRWLTTIHAYGAEAAVEGVSGYLSELLALALGPRLEDVLAGLLDHDATPIVLEAPPTREFPDDPLVVIDPVDPSRNAAAAVSTSTMSRILEAAAAFLHHPGPTWFDPPPPAAWSPQRIRGVIDARGTTVVAVSFPPDPNDIDDTRHARLRRASRLFARQLRMDDCIVHGAAWDIGLSRPALVAFELDARALAGPRLHVGPPEAAGAHAERFRDRWEGAPDAVGPVEVEDGRLRVLRRRDHDTPASCLAEAVRRVDGADVLAAADAPRVLGPEEAIADVDPLVLTRLLDRRRVWQTWGNGA